MSNLLLPIQLALCMYIIILHPYILQIIVEFPIFNATHVYMHVHILMACTPHDNYCHYSLVMKDYFLRIRKT